MPRPIRLLAGLICLLAALPVGAARVYQWKDANGVTHYSDEPPPAGQEFRGREVTNAPATGSAAAQDKPGEDPDCAMARRNLDQLKSDRPVGLDANGDGKPDKEMTAEERGQQVAKMEQTLKARCQPAQPEA